MNSYPHNIDPAKTNWLNILPLMQDLNVLHIGRDQVRRALIMSGCASVISLKNRGQEDDPTLRDFSDLCTFENGSFDVCIVDDMESLSLNKDKMSFSGMQRTISRLLKNEGVLLIGFLKGPRQFSKKLVTAPLLKASGYQKVLWFLCMPSFEEPNEIYPATQGKRQIRRDLKPTSPDGTNLKQAMKYLAKILLARISAKHNPLWGTMLMAFKQKSVYPGHGTVADSEYNKTGIKGSELNKYTVWYAKQNSGKQVGLVYKPGHKSQELVAVCKVCNFPFPRSSMIKREYHILRLLSNHVDTLEKQNIVVPLPLFFKTNGVYSFSIETSVSGTPLSEMKGEVWTEEFMEKTVKKLLLVQLHIQQSLAQYLKEQIPRLDSKYFTNTTDASYYYFNDAQRLDGYQRFVQHGDFTDVNILYNSASQSWGIIDWEWTSTGFPPLFDVFHLFFSFRFTQNANRPTNLLDSYYRSFIDTFFCENWFSAYIRGYVYWYCEQIDISTRFVFEYFMDFLLFLYNKYKIDYKLPEYEEMHRSMLLYALEHRNKFGNYSAKRQKK